MLKRIFSIAIISLFTASISFASQLTLKSDATKGIGLTNTYTLVLEGDGKEKSANGTLVISRIKRSRTQAHRSEALIYESWDEVSFNNHSYKIHFLSMTEKDGSADGVWKAYDSKGKLVDKGTYQFKTEKSVARTGKL